MRAFLPWLLIVLLAVTVVLLLQRDRPRKDVEGGPGYGLLVIIVLAGAVIAVAAFWFLGAAS